MIITIAGNTFTPGNPGNILGLSTPLLPGASTAPIIINVGVGSVSQLAGRGLLQLVTAGGLVVGAVSGVSVKLYVSPDGVNFDTNPLSFAAILLPALVNGPYRQSMELDQGIYQLVMTNLDLANAVGVGATLGTFG